MESGGHAGRLEEAVAAERSRTLTIRLRLLALATIGIVVMFILGNPTVRSGSIVPFVALRMTALGVLTAFLVATYQPRFAAYQLPAALLLASGIAALAAVGGVLRHDISVTVSLHIILMLMTAAVLPWGVTWQATVCAVCAVLLVAVVAIVGTPGRADPVLLVLINDGAGALLSLFVAYQARSAYDRAVRENLALRAAEERNRSLNEQLEAKVLARTAELEDALADQRAVTRAISHDLRQPLRHIEGYTRLLEEDLGNLAGGDHHDRLDKVRTATSRMWRMVDSLLALSRIAVRPLERRVVDLSGCAAAICDDLVRSEPGRQVEFAIAPGLSEDCDAELVRNLLRELVANAWKFTRQTEAARIEMGRREGAIFVRDNGAGFDMDHTRRLFHAFERLHHTAEFEGEGMGLAICERIVRRHGGRIWAEGSPGHGATFYFTLRGND